MQQRQQRQQQENDNNLAKIFEYYDAAAVAKPFIDCNRTWPSARKLAVLVNPSHTCIVCMYVYLSVYT